MKINSIYSILDYFFSAISGFLLLALISSNLGLDGAGQYTVLMTYSGAFALILSLGFNQRMSRLIATDDEVAYNSIHQFFLFRFFVALPVGLVLTYCVAILIDINMSIAMLLCVTYVFLVNQVTSLGVIFTARNETKFQFLGSFLVKLFVLIVAFILLDENIDELFIYASFSTFLIFIILYFSLVFRSEDTGWGGGSNTDLRYIGVAILASSPFLLFSILEYFSMRISVVILNEFLSIEEVGIFGIAFAVINAAQLVPLAITKVVYPRLTILASSYQYHAQLKLLVKVASLYVIYSCIFFVVFFYFGEFLLTLLFSDVGYEVVDFTILLSVLLPVYCLNRLVNYALLANEFNRPVPAIVFSGLLLNVALTCYLIEDYKLYAAIVGAFSAELLVLVLGALVYFRGWRNAINAT